MRKAIDKVDKKAITQPKGQAVEYIFQAIQHDSVGEIFAHSVGAVVRGVLK